MAETKRLFEKAGFYTVLECILLSVAVFALFRSWKAVLGIWIGAILAQTGLYAIIQYTRSLTPENATKVRGAINYTLRYAFYGIVMGLCAWQGVPVLSMLGGFLAGKLALILYSGVNRKEVENGNSQ